ncbi:MAG: diguanylate cyclase [Marinobacter sp.]|uniref:sensor domain-containing diguanylate cyclase n=1 Tax=Marinobacter sp. TaxID=50741 RepID=UPI00299E9254|nr:diguanylate cyclase [Marinobacter sp.]MDX1756095.1 diguanylate cyclase [Marinobacter sp.]
MHLYRLACLCIVTGSLYYLGAWVGVHFAALSSGIVILWPPNAVLLAAMLSTHSRHWPALAAAALIAEVAADVPAFTVVEALLFGLVNVAECLLAAGLIRYALSRYNKGEMDWRVPRDVTVFLVVVFFVVSPMAAVGGASIYSFVLERESPFLTFWRLWWVGDATGLIVLTPLIHMLLHIRRHWRDMALTIANQAEITAAWLCTLAICFAIFSVEIQSQNYLAVTPLLAIVLPVWIAIRFGSLPGSLLSASVALYAAFATAADLGPFIRQQQDQSALLTQEFTGLFTVLLIYVAAFVQQNRRHTRELTSALSELQSLAEELEERVRQRTTELRQANRQLRDLALTDDLTGIANRRQLYAAGTREQERSQRTGHPFAILLLDIDHFKQVNDNHGHDAGDTCLKQFAQILSSQIRSMDQVGRWGGEEFLIIVPESHHVNLAALGEKILRSVANHRFRINQHSLRLTVSIGAATWKGGYFDRLVSQADRALYEAKRAGRNRMQINNANDPITDS